MKEVVLILIHGMGRTEENYDQGFNDRIRNLLPPSIRNRLYIDRIYYQDILQENQSRVWKAASSQLRYHGLRKFLLYGFGDAAGLETQKGRSCSPYTKAQIRIAKTLLTAQTKLQGVKPIVLLAQSLGGQILSNYIWDSQQYDRDRESVNVGIWKDPQKFSQDIAGKDRLSQSELKFMAGCEVRSLYTTGCNIPIFTAGHAEILPIKRPHRDFQWHNYYDKHDVLGWPLRTLSGEYRDLVEDHQIEAGRWPGRMWKGWNPLSHREYWVTSTLLADLAGCVEGLLTVG